MLITKLNLVAAAIAGTVTVAALADDPTASEMYASAADEPSCFVSSSGDEDGILVMAWADPGASGSYRMVATQRTGGGGGFDIVQEGDFNASSENPELLSDMTMDVDAQFSIRLKTWNQAGELSCDWSERV
jgi:hypothetical protein